MNKWKYIYMNENIYIYDGAKLGNELPAKLHDNINLT